MKYLSLVLGAVMLLTVAGCGASGVSEDRPIAQIVEEAKQMTVADLEAVVAKYKSAIESKKPALDKLKEKLVQIPITQMMGEDAKNLKAEVSEITASVKALTDRLNVYLNQLKAQK